MNTIRATLCEYSLSILIFGLSSFAAFIITLRIHHKRKTRYLLWKKDTINLLIYKTEKEFGKDEFMEELFTENIRLETENKILKKQVSNAKIMTILILLTVFIAMLFRRYKNDKKEVVDNTDGKKMIMPDCISQVSPKRLKNITQHKCS